MICPSQKIVYESRGDANAHLRRINKSTSAGGLAVYVCRFCGHFHLGHVQRRAKYRKILKRRGWKRRQLREEAA